MVKMNNNSVYCKFQLTNVFNKFLCTVHNQKKNKSETKNAHSRTIKMTSRFQRSSLKIFAVLSSDVVST